MPRYIDADKLINKIFPIGMVHDGQYTIGAKAIKIAIDKIPTADVVEVVRCKDCEHRHTFGCPMYHEEYIDWDDDGYWETDLIIHDATNDNDFCNYGERNINECKEK